MHEKRIRTCLFLLLTLILSYIEFKHLSLRSRNSIASYNLEQTKSKNHSFSTSNGKVEPKNNTRAVFHVVPHKTATTTIQSSTSNGKVEPKNNTSAVFPVGAHKTATTTIQYSTSNGKVKPKNNIRAVFHVGPHKTATTTIQSFSEMFQRELHKDGYEMPWVGLEKIMKQKARSNTLTNLKDFAFCFFKKEICMNELVDSAFHISQRQQNVFISAEQMSSANFLESGITELFDFSKHWDNVTIILGYRRFYDWQQSRYNEQNKHRLNKLQPWKESKMDFLRKAASESYDILDIVTKYKNRFEDVRVINFHDQSDNIVKTFYCDVIPDANYTCTAIKKYLNNHNAVSNPSIDLNTILLAMAARDRGWIKNRELRKTINKIHKHRRNSNLDFNVTCPSEDILNILLNRSLLIEQKLLPDFFHSPMGEIDLRRDFDKQAKTKLCEVDVYKTLKRSEWKSLLKKLE